VTKGLLIKKEILNHPEHYFSAQSKSLEARVSEVKLSEDEENEIVKDHTQKFVRDKVLGAFKIGEIVSEIINWNDSVDEDLKEAKKEYLLAQYFEKNDHNKEALSQIKSFLSDAQGNTLFNKILRILDDSPPDIELADHLSKALQHMVNNNFHKLFDQHKYALSQIEQLTPQALTILSDHGSWPLIKLGSYTSMGSKISSDWLNEFTQAYCGAKGIYEPGIMNRVKHSINELISTRLIEAHSVAESNAKCNITQVGQLLLPYINA